jgi:hypothetical protein
MSEVSLTHRLARRKDIPALTALMERSIAELQQPYLDQVQIAASRQKIMGLDSQLIEDGTYFVIAAGGELAGCAAGADAPRSMAAMPRPGATPCSSIPLRIPRASGRCTPIPNSCAAASAA